MSFVERQDEFTRQIFGVDSTSLIMIVCAVLFVLAILIARFRE